MAAVDQYRFLVAAALADGSVDPSERPILTRAARELGLSQAQAEQVEQEVRQGGDVKVAIPADAAERARLFRSLVDLAAADGKVDRKELALFSKVASRFGLDALQVEDILRAAADARRSS